MTFGKILAGAALASLAFGQVAAAPIGTQAAEAKLDASVSSADQLAWLKDFSSAPNHVGSPHDKQNADATLALFRSWGWDAHVEVFHVLYPTPISTTLELITPQKVTLGGQEPPVAGDPTSAETKDALPPYVAYQGDGDVTAPVVYVNYGMPDDYEALARRGIDVKGKIVLARYGAGWRGLKPKLAQEHGAVGCLIYSDPANDGYAHWDSYPDGGGRPDHGVQRGSVQDMTTYPGDPLTPGVGATEGAKRLTREQAVTLLKIPTLPISWSDASKIIAGLQGPVVTGKQRGGLGQAYHWGGTPAVTVHLAVKSDWSLKPLYDVIATLKGAKRPDEWVIRANHRDGWVFGAADPLTGHGAMLSEAKALGSLYKSGWRPDRTIVYASWDGEEPGLLGSTEWAETHADELQKKAVVYINTDNSVRGVLEAEASHDLQHFVNQAARDVTDPETGSTVQERQRADILASDYDGDGEADAVKAAKAGGDLLVGPLGSGSDYSAFLQHLGIPSINLGFGGEDASGGSYHSVYDSYTHVTKFDDPGLVYGAALSKLVGRMVLRAADADVGPARYSDLAATVARYVTEVKKLADTQREKDKAREELTAEGDFKLASNVLDPTTAPAPKQATPLIDFAALEKASDHLARAAGAADGVLAKADTLPPATRAALDAQLRGIDQLMLSPDGLPGRPWYRNLIYAPGTLTGYGAKTLPGIREAIEQRRFADAVAYVAKTAAVLDAYAGRLDAAVKGAKP
ncbi:transferrin receptor-like dimerization domain-containing protein [Sphingomonas oryzagri]|uniref:Transferrin receptor-like dimerization domain-containing protein n=1 Tax=Sphingomonas oryzagri TaxID=3042314 RepID=A0ABT6N6N3_9SPHN|nr:transferrin receptor-like dimerization domain-containing protein [Sphingomonas oryzagri]MDH7640760.1 transferrin receptor-like dimerization domain-containing protein [Sphingomonas oryzagri]